MTQRRNILIFLSCFVIAGLATIVFTAHKPLSDFGNYYFGAKFFDANDQWKVYDPGKFNALVNASGYHGLFLDHTSVPPQSVMFYRVFTRFNDPYTAKLVFSITGFLFFGFTLMKFLLRRGTASAIQLSSLFLLLLVPSYYNILFGQSYFFIGGMVLLVLMWTEEGREWPAAILLSVCILLKITPAILLLLFAMNGRGVVVKRALISWLILTFVSTIIIGPEVHFGYYVNILPRLMDGFINDPFAYTNQGVLAILRRSFMHDDVLNPSVANGMSSSTMHLVALIFNAAIFFFTMITLLKEEKTNSRSFFLLILVSTIISGYYNVYGFVVLAIFFPFVQEWNTKKITQVILLVICIAIPSSLQNAVALLHNSRFVLLVVVWIMEIFPVAGIKYYWSKATFLTIVFLMIQGGKVFEKNNERMKYFHPGNFKSDYVLNYQLDGDSLTVDCYTRSGLEKRSMLFLGDVQQCSIPPDSTFFSLDGNHIISHVTYLNDSAVFLSDAGRGPGLFHLFVLSQSDFRSMVYKNQ